MGSRIRGATIIGHVAYRTLRGYLRTTFRESIVVPGVVASIKVAT